MQEALPLADQPQLLHPNAWREELFGMPRQPITIPSSGSGPPGSNNPLEGLFILLKTIFVYYYCKILLNIQLIFFLLLLSTVVPTRLGLSKRSSDQQSEESTSTRPAAETQTSEEDIAASSLHRQLNLHNHVNN